MARGAGKNNWALFLLVLAGIVIGSFIAQATAGISALSWLNYGKNFGFTTPFVLDLGILVLTFGLKIILSKRHNNDAKFINDKIIANEKNIKKSCRHYKVHRNACSFFN